MKNLAIFLLAIIVSCSLSAYLKNEKKSKLHEKLARKTKGDDCDDYNDETSPTKSGCEAITSASCEWDDNKASDQCAKSKKKISTSSTSKKKMKSNVITCSLNSDSTDCTDTTNCTFSNNECTLKCTNLLEKDCNDNNGSCVWDGTANNNAGACSVNSSTKKKSMKKKMKVDDCHSVDISTCGTDSSSHCEKTDSDTCVFSNCADVSKDDCTSDDYSSKCQLDGDTCQNITETSEKKMKIKAKKTTGCADTAQDSCSGDCKWVEDENDSTQGTCQDKVCADYQHDDNTDCPSNCEEDADNKGYCKDKSTKKKKLSKAK